MKLFIAAAFLSFQLASSSFVDSPSNLRGSTLALEEDYILDDIDNDYEKEYEDKENESTLRASNMNFGEIEGLPKGGSIDYEDEDYDGYENKMETKFLTPPTEVGKPEECVTGYTNYPTGGCKGRNELGVFNLPSAAACAERCDSKPDCVSFEYRKSRKSGTTCQLSSSCNSLSMTVMAENDPNNWYLKSTSPSLDCIEGYKHYSTGGCVGRNELGWENVSSVALCARKCDALPDCVSFEYEKSGNKCRLSNSCKSLDMTVMAENDPMYWYLKLDPTPDCEL